MYRINLFIILILVSANAWSKSYVVLSSTSQSVKESIDVLDLRDIFLGHKLYWRDGKRIFPAHFNKKSKTMKVFLDTVLDMSPRKFNNYWRRRLFSGKGHPPIEHESAGETLEYIKRTNGAVGIVGNLPKKKIAGLYFFKPATDGRSLNLVKF